MVNQRFSKLCGNISLQRLAGTGFDHSLSLLTCGGIIVSQSLQVSKVLDRKKRLSRSGGCLKM